MALILSTKVQRTNARGDVPMISEREIQMHFVASNMVDKHRATHPTSEDAIKSFDCLMVLFTLKMETSWALFFGHYLELFGVNV